MYFEIKMEGAFLISRLGRLGCECVKYFRLKNCRKPYSDRSRKNEFVNVLFKLLSTYTSFRKR